MPPIQFTDADTADWKTALAPGDVVRFRFPVAQCCDHDATAGPKLRPCLVLEVFELSGHRFVKLAYGTSANTKANKGCEVRVNQPDGCAAAGLYRPTRFVGARAILVSLDHSGFEPFGKSGSPLMGSLDSQLRTRLTDIRDRLRAGQAPATKRHTTQNTEARKGPKRPVWFPGRQARG